MKKIAFLTTIFPMKKKYLLEFFSSLRQQTYTDFEIIVVNDGYEQFEQILNEFKELKVIELHYSSTIAKNREFGINYVIENEYDILIFGDSDDYFSDNRVSKSIELLDKYHIVVNDLSLFYEESVSVRRYISNRLESGTSISSDFIKDKNIFGLSNTAVKVKILDKVSFDKDLVAVDWLLYKKLLNLGHTAVFTNEIETYYRQYSGNTVGLKTQDGRFPLWWEDMETLKENN